MYSLFLVIAVDNVDVIVAPWWMAWVGLGCWSNKIIKRQTENIVSLVKFCHHSQTIPEQPSVIVDVSVLDVFVVHSNILIILITTSRNATQRNADR
jgi:hypothetical protein